MVAVPSAVSESCFAVAVTVCAVLQLVVPKVSDAGLTVRSASPPLLRATATVTLEVGAAFSFTVQVAEPPSGTVTLEGASTMLRSLSASVATRSAVTPA